MFRYLNQDLSYLGRIVKIAVQEVLQKPLKSDNSKCLRDRSRLKMASGGPKSKYVFLVPWPAGHVPRSARQSQ